MSNPNSNSLDYFKASGEPPQQLSGASMLSAGTVPALRALGAVISGAGAITPLAPAGLTTDDIELLWVESADEAITLSTANGFAEVAGSPISVPNATATIRTRGALFWRRYAGQGNPTIATTTNHLIARRIAVSGCVASGDPWDFVQVSSEAVEDTSGSATGNTTLDANRFIVILGGASKPDANSTAEFDAIANASLTSLTERADNATNVGNGGFILAITGEMLTAGTVSATTYTKVTAAYKWHFVVALKPGEEGTNISRSDSVAVTESRLLSVGVQTSRSESITVSESTGRLVTSFTNVSDGVTVSESASAQIANALNIGVADTVTVSESPIVNIVPDGPLADLSVITNESVTVTEAFTLSISTAAVNKSESVSLSESVTVAMVRLIGVEDSIAVTEAVTVIDGVTISKSENVTVTESRTVAAARGIATSDSVAATEAATASIGLEISKSESIALTEAVGITVSASQINVNDGSTVTEAHAENIGTVIAVSESVAITEGAQVLSGSLLVSLFSNVSVTDVPLMFFAGPIPNEINFDATVLLDRAFYTTVIRDRAFASSTEIDRAFSREVEKINE